MKRFSIRKRYSTTEQSLEHSHASFNYDEVFSVVLAGEREVGKTALAQHWTTGKFSNISETSVDSYERIISTNGKKIKMLIWDSIGKESAKTLSPDIFRMANAVILLYDSTNKTSFLRLPEWRNLALKHCVSCTQLFIVGTKRDLEESQAVSSEEASSYGAICRLKVFETSSRTGSGVEDALMGILCDLVKFEEMRCNQRMNIYDTMSTSRGWFEKLWSCCTPMRFCSTCRSQEKWKKSRSYRNIPLKISVITSSDSFQRQGNSDKLTKVSKPPGTTEFSDWQKIMGPKIPPPFFDEKNQGEKVRTTMELLVPPSPLKQHSSQSSLNQTPDIDDNNMKVGIQTSQRKRLPQPSQGMLESSSPFLSPDSDIKDTVLKIHTATVETSQLSAREDQLSRAKEVETPPSEPSGSQFPGSAPPPSPQLPPAPPTTQSLTRRSSKSSPTLSPRRFQGPNRQQFLMSDRELRRIRYMSQICEWRKP